MAAGKLPESDNFNHYDLLNIKQSLLFAEKKAYYPPESMWEGGLEHLASRYGFTPRHSNPYLRQVYAADKESLLQVSRALQDAFAEGFEKSNFFIITLGLIEAWIDLFSGLYINNPGGLKDMSLEKRIKLHQMSFAECVAAMKKVIAIIKRNKPDAPIVFTVSPVFLARTFSGRSIAEAAIYGKSVLRAAVEEVLSDRDMIYYFPSYEHVLMHGGHEQDGRHVRSDCVQRIVEAFRSSYLEQTMV